MKDRGRGKTGVLGWALGATFVLALIGGVVSAKKPQPPPPPPPVEDPGDVGVIYVQVGNAMYAVEPDGSTSSDLQLTEFRASIDHYPSRGRYGTAQEQWFLQKRITKPNDWLPDGMARYELYAVSEGGKSVLLFSEENYDLQYGQYNGSIGWTADGTVVDGKVSFVARKWVEDPDATEWPVGWSIGEAGIWVATLDPQDLLTADGALELEWSMLTLEFTLNQGVGFKVYHEWSPDGTAMVYKDYFLAGGGIWVAEDQELGWTTTRIGGGNNPRWSNDGLYLAFELNGDICTMDPEGNDVTVVVADPPDTRKDYVAVFGPFWSPSDTHLVHTRATIEKDPKPPGSAPRRSYESRRVLLTEDGGVNSLKLPGSQIFGWRE